MRLSESERLTLIGLQLEKAAKNLSQADDMIRLGYYDMAANRYYYACFHAIQALLINNGISCHTHAGTIAEFGKSFILTGTFDVSFGRFISRLEQLREKGDYNCAYEIEESEVRLMAEPAHELLELIKNYLNFNRISLFRYDEDNC